MNFTISIEERIVTKACAKANAIGKSLEQLICDYLGELAGDDDPEHGIEDFRSLSGRGHSRDWRFNRDEIHECA